MLKPLLNANWHYLAFLNFAADPALLAARVPAGTELDLHDGAAWLSVVGFLSGDTVLVGEPLPRQRLFERVELRLCVRQRNLDNWRRGTVVVRAIVPRAIAPTLTHTFPGEPLIALTMRHDISDQDGAVAVEYAWRAARKWESLSMTATGEPQLVPAGLQEEFITERPWAYIAFPTRVSEYRITHPRWRTAPATNWKLDPEIFGPEFAEVLKAPRSAFLAEGSHVQLQRRES